MKIVIKNLDDEFLKLKKEIQKQSKTKLERESKEIYSELVIATPVDTGLARESWSLIQKDKETVIIENNVPYIEELNNGHSQQAPANFIETIALRHGKPLGAIIAIK